MQAHAALNFKPGTWALWIGTVVLCAPSFIKPVIMYSSHSPLKIELQSTEPPRKAFDLIKKTNAPTAGENLLREWASLSEVKSLNLNQLLLKNQRAQVEAHEGVHRVSLEPMILKRNSEVPEQKAMILAHGPQGSSTIVGRIRLSEGVMAGDRTLRIKHIVDGRVQEVGSIDPRKGTFSIHVANSSGLLRAELLDAQGAPVASGEFRPSGPGQQVLDVNPEIILSPRNQIHFKTTPYLGFHPSVKGASGTAGLPSETVIASIDGNVKSDEMGDVIMPRMSPDSWTPVRTRAPGYHESLAIVSPLKQQELPLFSERLIKAFAGPHQSLAEYAGMLWVNVTYHGQTLENVELSIEGSENKAVFGNGSYVFTGLEPGFYQLLAKKEGRLLGHLNVIVDQGAAAVGEIEVTDQWSQVTAKSFDAFTGAPAPSRLDLQSLEKSIYSDGEAVLQLPRVHRLSFGYVYPENSDYIPTQIVYSDDTESLVVPLIRESWLQQQLLQKKLNRDPQAGVIVGFVAEGDYDVYLPHEEEYSADNVVFFDSTGAAVTGPVVGGGFILYNVPAATQSVTVVSRTSGLVNTQVLPVDASSVSVLNINF